ncbi:MAG TPA: DNA repair protein RecN [Acidobacteriota bacterium]|nr:DNA repair protein RecN [Acidobacteriota bacterium]
MLRILRIRNLALIRKLEMEFGTGLNLLTGETGSGKSILVDALGLLLGARSSQDMIRSECDTAVIEGLFETRTCGTLEAMLLESGLESDDHTLLVRRELSLSGRNRVFINNSISTLAFLKSIGEKLADIHGQQEQRSLLDLSTHREWLDCFGGNSGLVTKVRDSYRRLREAARRLEVLRTGEQERLRRIDILRYQIDEIGRFDPHPGEDAELERERNLLANHEKILALATEAYALLYESESSALTSINRLGRILEELATYDRSWTQYLETLQESRYKLEDLSYAARNFAARSDFSPNRLEQVHQRLEAIGKLTKKYGPTIEEVLSHKKLCEKDLEDLLSAADTAERITEEFARESDAYRIIADGLSSKRKKDAETLEREIRKEFAALAMGQMELRVWFHENVDRAPDGLLPAGCGLNGRDDIEFMIAPNKGENFKPLARIASGGELSRLMLAIQSLCGSEGGDRTLVFDEVDTGIGGRAAEAVGKRLLDISGLHQVLCVTHLPQIAAFAKHHFNVCKEVTGGRTETVVKELNPSDRIKELSRMLGGEAITETTERYAMEMLERAAAAGNMERSRS